MTPVLITCLRFLCTWYRARQGRQDEEHSGTRLSENPWIKQWLFIKVVYHSHGQTGWFMVCVHGSQSSGQVNFVPEIAFNICTRQSHLPENGREGLKLVSKIPLKKWNANISFWNIPSGKTGLPFQMFRCSRKFSVGKTQNVVFHLPSNRFSQKIVVNSKQLPLPRWQGFLVLLPTVKLLFCIQGAKEEQTKIDAALSNAKSEAR